MSRVRYESLLCDFGNAAGIDDVASFLATGHLRSGEFDLAVLHDEQLDPDTVFVYVDLGLPDEGQGQADGYKAMLDANYFIGSPQTGVLCLQPDTRHAVLAVRLSLDRLGNGAELANALSRCLDQAERWRKSRKGSSQLQDGQTSSELPSGSPEHRLWL